MIELYIKNYRDYINNLPLSRNQKTILSEKDEIHKNPDFYLKYASLFSDCFKFSDKDVKVNLLNIAGFLCYKSVLITDSKLDSNSKGYNIADEIVSLCTEEYIKILTYLFGLDKKYWEYYNLRKNEFLNSAETAKHLFQKKTVSIEEFENLSDQKSAFGKLAIDSLSMLNDVYDSDIHKNLLLSHKYFSIGFQITDDIFDLKEDFHNRQFNYAMYYYNQTVPNNYKIAKLHKCLFLDGIFIKLYNLAVDYLNKSLAIAKYLEVKKWIGVIDSKLEEIKNAIDVTNEYLLLTKTKSSIYNTPVKQNHMIGPDALKIEGKNLKFIIEQWKRGFPEIKHIMILTKREEFNNEQEAHITDTFQRALLNDCLISVSKKYEININDFMDSECNYFGSRLVKRVVFD